MGCLLAVVRQDHTRQTVEETLVLPQGGCKGGHSTLDLTVEPCPFPASSPDMSEYFEPTKAAALERLAGFVTKAGHSYAARRNYDLGPGNHASVSQLSPYLRSRAVTEEEIIKAVLEQHSFSAAEKFIQEVFWRTYWKGWLELRPAVWEQYLSALGRAWDDVQTQSGLRQLWETACRGETEIGCFNAWAKELVETGYLHNHARMWFASIWIFTLKLPWELGADFFLRHLLDGDPASNTLSWRWVAGLQTPGKTYLARTSNISKFTEGRFHPKWQLAGDAPAMAGPEAPSPRDLPQPTPVNMDKRSGWLVHEDDLSIGHVCVTPPSVANAILAPQTKIGPLLPAPAIGEFRLNLMKDAVARHHGQPDDVVVLHNAADLVRWSREQGLEQVVTPHAPVGPVAQTLHQASTLQDMPPIVALMRDYDRIAWPHATRGFFPFKKHIPDFIRTLGLSRTDTA